MSNGVNYLSIQKPNCSIKDQKATLQNAALILIVTLVVSAVLFSGSASHISSQVFLTTKQSILAGCGTLAAGLLGANFYLHQRTKPKVDEEIDVQSVPQPKLLGSKAAKWVDRLILYSPEFGTTESAKRAGARLLSLVVSTVVFPIFLTVDLLHVSSKGLYHQFEYWLSLDPQTIKNVVTGIAMTIDLCARALIATMSNQLMGGEENGDARKIGLMIQNKDGAYAGVIAPRYKQLPEFLLGLDPGCKLIEIAGQTKIQLDMIVSEDDPMNYTNKLYERTYLGDPNKKVVALEVSVDSLIKVLNKIKNDERYELFRVCDF